jgi:hypothetical protein
MTKKVYYSNQNEMVVSTKEDDTFVFTISPIDYLDNPIQLDLQLEIEDVKELINDLQYYIDNKNK